MTATGHKVATSTIPVSAPALRRWLWRTLGCLIGVLLLAVLGVCGWCFRIAHSALPQLDGTVRVAGLSTPVTVLRDGHGIPTIQASNLQDLFFAQGYVTAQDRLWQMEGMRRFAAGELSEILGAEYVKHDREQRILGLRAAARKSVELATPEESLHFAAYAGGVNAFIESHRERLPVEFRILKYSPQPWTPEDSMVIAGQMVKDLNHGHFNDALVREKVLAKLGPELTADLYVNTSWHDRPPSAARPALEAPPDSDDNEEEQEPGSMTNDAPTPQLTQTLPLSGDLDVAGEEPFAVGSNNWVVSGAHTVTGKPLLSNDMHLGHQMPNLWYAAHLRSGNLDVAGVTLPGMPYVIVGHNQRIAWGFTNVGPTVEDAYIETLDASGQYQIPDGWKKADHRREIIHVKGGQDVMVDVTVTRHGPIISELVPGESRPLALRWTLYDGIRGPFFALDSAQNWTEFRQALSQMDAPGQNAVYADVEGNIGYQATGKVPIRATGDGSLPENGSDNVHEWTGYIPFDQLPNVFNPPTGVIATANGRITPDGYPFSISTEWEAPWRTARIYRVLESGRKFSAADMLALQTDTLSEGERYFAERFVYAVDHARKATARAQQAADILRQWDGHMSADSAAATLQYRARAELTRLLLEPKLGPASQDRADSTELSWKSYQWAMRSVWMENVLAHQPKRWLPEKYSDYNELLAAAVDAAVSDRDAPKDLLSWGWGNFNPVEIQHPILGQIPVLQHWTGPGMREQSGSAFTVKAVTRRHGPSERLTVNLADLDQSTLNLVTGEGGNFLSPYYMDQWRAWYEGFTFPWPFSEQTVQKAKAHELKLEP